jgi:hypothetical protein
MPKLRKVYSEVRRNAAGKLSFFKYGAEWILNSLEIVKSICFIAPNFMPIAFIHSMEK